MKKLYLFCLLAAVVSNLYAQEVNYDNVSFTQPIPAVYPSLQQNISFDVRASITDRIKESFMSADEVERMQAIFRSPMRVRFGKFSQVDSTGDFHVISLVQRFKYVKPAPPATGQAVNIAIHTRVYDKFGTLLYDRGTVFPELMMPAENEWGSQYDRKDAKTRMLIATQEAISQSVQPFVNQIYGYNASLLSKLAYLDGVKKKPELKVLEEQVEQLRTVLRKEGLAKFLTASAAYLPVWEKLADYKGDGDANEVKRAALQNLSLVTLLNGDYDKATVYIDRYKAIDKTVKAMFGLLSYRNSDELETLMNTLRAQPEVEIKPVSDRVITATQAVWQNTYLSIPGTIVLEGKNAGTYKGDILVKRPEPVVNEEPGAGSSGLRLGGGMVNLSAEDLLITVPGTDAAGKPKPMIVRSSVVKSLQGEDGTRYQLRKFGTVGLGDGAAWYLLRSDYQSPKVTIYRSVLPSSGEYVVLKNGDDKGVKSSLLNARRNVLDYLKECTALEGKYKNGNTPFDIKQVAVDYTNCQ